MADSQPDPRACIFRVMIESLEYTKDFLLILGVNIDTVVVNLKTPERTLPDRRDTDIRRFFASVFQSIADEIQKDLL